MSDPLRIRVPNVDGAPECLKEELCGVVRRPFSPTRILSSPAVHVFRTLRLMVVHGSRFPHRWRSTEVAEGRPVVDEAALSVGRDPADVETVYNVSGHLEREPLSETRNDEGRWIGGGVAQWVEELTFAVLERGAAAFVYLLAPGEVISDTTLNRWVHEVVPAVREAIAKR
jgi:hypothetical protein